MKKFIKRNPVFFYFALTCIVSWSCMLPIIGIDGFLGKVTLSDDLLPQLFAAMCAGPLIAGLMATWLTNGTNGFKTLFKMLTKWKVQVRFYLIAILVAPVLTLTTALILSRTISPKFTPLLFTSNDVGKTILGGIVAGMVAGFFEELGWTGFATPQLKSRHSVLTAGLTIGVVWGIWHFPLFVERDPAGRFPLIVLLMSRLITHLPAFRIVMTWVYDRTQSLLMAIVMHMSLTASAFIFQANIKNGIDIILSNLALTFLLYVTVVIINLSTRGGIVKGVSESTVHP